MKKWVLFMGVLFSTSFASAADNSATELAALKAQLKMLTERLATLEAKQQQTANGLPAFAQAPCSSPKRA